MVCCSLSSKDFCPYCTKAKNALFSILSKDEVDVEEVEHLTRVSFPADFFHAFVGCQSAC